MSNLTANEINVLEAILFNEYNDGCEINYPVYTKLLADYTGGLNGLSLSGTVSSLDQKGFTFSLKDGKNSTISVTKTGFEALMANEESLKQYVEYTGENPIKKVMFFDESYCFDEIKQIDSITFEQIESRLMRAVGTRNPENYWAALTEGKIETRYQVKSGRVVKTSVFNWLTLQHVTE